MKTFRSPPWNNPVPVSGVCCYNDPMTERMEMPTPPPPLESKNSPVAGILRRLEARLTENKEVKDRSRRITELRQGYRTDKELWEGSPGRIGRLRDRYVKGGEFTYEELVDDYMAVFDPEGVRVDYFIRSERGEGAFRLKAQRELRRYTEDSLAAYLVTALERDRQAENFEVRPDQIEGIAALLSGEHLHAPTGYGKSSVVIPIAALVRQLVDPDRSVLVTTANNKLKQELIGNLKRLKTLFPKELEGDLAINEITGAKDMEATDEVAALKRYLEHVDCLIEIQGLPEEKRRSVRLLRNTLYQLYLSKMTEGKEKDVASRLPEAPGVVVTDDSSAIFEYLEDEGVMARLSRVIADEAHVAYDRGSEFIFANGELFASADSADFIYHYLLFRKLFRLTEGRQKDFFEVSDKRVVFRDDKIVELATLVHKTLAEDPAFFADVAGEVTEYFYGRRSPLYKDLPDLSAEKITAWFRERLAEEVKGQDMGEMEEATPEMMAETYLQRFIPSLEQAMNMREGKEYYYGDGERLVVRDSYLGLALKDHEFSAFDRIAVMAKEGRPEVANPNLLNERSMSYQSWVANLGAKFQAVSGTLLSYSLKTPRRVVPSPFAGFLHTLDRRRPFSTEKRTPPTPRMEYTAEGYLPRLTEAVREWQEGEIKKPVLVSCFSEREAAALEEHLRQQGVVAVRVMPDMAETEEDAVYRTLADQKGVVISSGKSGLGVDIKESGGGFPDLKTAIVGLPESRLQLWQVLGRRRRQPTAPEDALWLVSPDHLENETSYLDLVEKKKPGWMRKLGLDTPSREDIRAALSSGEENSVLAALDGLISGKESLRAGSDEFRLVYDVLTQKYLQPYYRSRVNELFSPDEQARIKRFGLDEYISPELFGRALQGIYTYQAQGQGMARVLQTIGRAFENLEENAFDGEVRNYVEYLLGLTEELNSGMKIRIMFR